MARVVVFNSVTLDGYFTGENGDMSCAQGPERCGVEWRITYDLMSSFWPTPAAMKMMPVVAKGMNSMTKIVFSRSMDKASWSNTKVVKGEIAAEVRRMKKGSTNTRSLVVPVALGKGRTMFEGVQEKLGLKRTKTRNFGNGNVVLSYEPVA